MLCFKKNVMAQAAECKSHHKLRSPWGSCHLLANYVYHSLIVAQKTNITAGSFLLPYKYCYWHRQTSRNIMPFPAHYCCHFLHVPPSKGRPAVSATFHLPSTCLHLHFPACANGLCQWKYRLPVLQELCLYWANVDVAMEYFTSTKILVALHKNHLFHTADIFTASASCFSLSRMRSQEMTVNSGQSGHSPLVTSSLGNKRSVLTSIFFPLFSPVYG